MWSVGCILGEMINGKAIFPGTSTLNQIERVLEVIGKPTSQEINQVQAALGKFYNKYISSSDYIKHQQQEAHRIH